MHGGASCHGAPVLMSLSPLPYQPTPLLGSLSAGEPEAEQLQHGEHRVGVGEWGVDRGRCNEGIGVAEAGGSF